MTSKYLTILYFITFCFQTLTAHSNSSFSFNNFGQNSRFESVISLHGDANVVNDSLSFNSSAGRAIYKNRIGLYKGNPRKLISFSTYFSFSIVSDSGIGNGLAFVVFSDDELKFLSVQFGKLIDDKYGDTNRTRVGIDLSNLGMNSGNRLQVWIDYESMSRRLEVRVSKFGENRPIDPLRFEQIDFTKIWHGKEGFFVSLSSVNKNSSQVCNVYSWSFKTRVVPDWMHSEPVDPNLLKQEEQNEVKIHKKSDCVMRVLSALILGVGLGALGSFIGMFVWTVFAKRRPILPEEYAMKPVVHDKASSSEKL